MRIQSINRYRVRSLFHADVFSDADVLSDADVFSILLFDTDRYSERLDLFRLVGIRIARGARIVRCLTQSISNLAI